MVSNSSIYAIYDNSQILIQRINLDEQSFGDLTVTSFDKPGAYPICTDVELNEEINRLYIGCMQNKTAVKTDDYNIWILEVDATNGTLL